MLSDSEEMRFDDSVDVELDAEEIQRPKEVSYEEYRRIKERLTRKYKYLLTEELSNYTCKELRRRNSGKVNKIEDSELRPSEADPKSTVKAVKGKDPLTGDPRVYKSQGAYEWSFFSRLAFKDHNLWLQTTEKPKLSWPEFLKIVGPIWKGLSKEDRDLVISTSKIDIDWDKIRS